jgi:two-component system, chemotaxis family, chemotaxis protein CheY
MAWINLTPSALSRRLASTKSGSSVGASKTTAANRVPRILVVDDDGVTRLVLGAALRDAGYEVEEVADGAEGLTAFRTRPADLVICDLVMPQHGGLETVRELRQSDPKVRILVVSGVIGSSAEHLRTAVRFGADRVLPKPVNLKELLTMVAGLLDRSL